MCVYMYDGKRLHCPNFHTMHKQSFLKCSQPILDLLFKSLHINALKWQIKGTLTLTVKFSKILCIWRIRSVHVCIINNTMWTWHDVTVLSPACGWNAGSLSVTRHKAQPKLNNPDLHQVQRFCPAQSFFCISTGLLSSHYKAKTSTPCNNL